jgi:hypothetical protein
MVITLRLFNLSKKGGSHHPTAPLNYHAGIITHQRYRCINYYLRFLGAGKQNTPPVGW